MENFDYEQLHPDHCWPNQYAREAYNRTQAPFGTQMNNGNVLECTLWNHYFMSEDGKQAELNPVGKSRIEYLARKRPYVIPSLYLQTTFDSKLDERRVKNIIEYAASKSMEPNAWQVTLVNREASGLFGREAPKAIDKMVGTGDQPPRYEPQIKSGFLQGSGGSGAGGGK